MEGLKNVNRLREKRVKFIDKEKYIERLKSIYWMRKKRVKWIDEEKLSKCVKIRNKRV